MKKKTIVNNVTHPKESSEAELLEVLIPMEKTLNNVPTSGLIF